MRVIPAHNPAVDLASYYVVCNSSQLLRGEHAQCVGITVSSDNDIVDPQAVVQERSDEQSNTLVWAPYVGRDSIECDARDVGVEQAVRHLGLTCTMPLGK